MLGTFDFSKSWLRNSSSFAFPRAAAAEDRQGLQGGQPSFQKVHASATTRFDRLLTEMSTIRVAGAVGSLVLLCVVGIDLASHATMAGRPENAAALERDLRTGLPLGSSLFTVQNFLSNRRIEFSINEKLPISISAIARNLQGSNLLIRESLALQFMFDDASKLKTLQARVVYTGP